MFRRTILIRMFVPGAHLHMNLRAAMVLISVLLLAGCETPERHSALERMEAADAAAKAAAAGPKETQAGRDWKGKKLPLTKFLDSSNTLNNLADYVGKKTVVLCVMKGFYSQGVCVYCTRQTADLAR